MSYPGSKGQAGTFERIIGQMPPHDIYVEAFAGSAQVFWRKRPARKTSILIDLNSAASASLRDAVRSAKAGVGGSALVLNLDALEWLETVATDFRWSDNVLMYFDPPYLLSTRKARRYYLHEFTDEDHARLLALLKSLRCRVLLSGYPSELYSSTLHNWRCLSYRTRTRGATVTECLWANFPEPTQLHDWRFAGRSFRQRLAYRRQAARWLARLQAMPPLKRGYLLNAIGTASPELARRDRTAPE